jgi:hypothetical protein
MVDFICYEPDGANDITFSQILEANEGKEMSFVVYSIISRDKRIVKVTPTKDWGGKSLLGAEIRYEDYSNAHRSVAYVAEVYPNSPAAESGLQPKTDFIIGNQFAKFETLDDIGRLTKANLEEEITFAVYNVENKQIRDVKIVPREGWGGQGILGWELFMGVKFSIPLEDEDDWETEVVVQEVTDEELKQIQNQEEVNRKPKAVDETKQDVEKPIIQKDEQKKIDKEEAVIQGNSQKSTLLKVSIPSEVEEAIVQKEVKETQTPTLTEAQINSDYKFDKDRTGNEEIKYESDQVKVEEKQITPTKRKPAKPLSQYNPFLNDKSPKNWNISQSITESSSQSSPQNSNEHTYERKALNENTEKETVAEEMLKLSNTESKQVIKEENNKESFSKDVEVMQKERTDNNEQSNAEQEILVDQEPFIKSTQAVNPSNDYHSSPREETKAAEEEPQSYTNSASENISIKGRQKLNPPTASQRSKNQHSGYLP